jgi:hypothetical protein
MKIHLVGAELLHVDGQADMVKLIGALPNFVNMPKNCPWGIFIQHNNVMKAHTVNIQVTIHTDVFAAETRTVSYFKMATTCPFKMLLHSTIQCQMPDKIHDSSAPLLWALDLATSKAIFRSV